MEALGPLAGLGVRLGIIAFGALLLISFTIMRQAQQPSGDTTESIIDEQP